MSRPVVGVIGNMLWSRTAFRRSSSASAICARSRTSAAALPLMFAGKPEITDIGALLDVVDGIVLTGARANVHPTRFGVEPHPRYEPYDHSRDALALPLVEACVERGVPLFGICRGFQEMSVAFGCSLHPEIRELPGPHEPSHAAAGERRDPSRPARRVRGPPRRAAHRPTARSPSSSAARRSA